MPVITRRKKTKTGISQVDNGKRDVIPFIMPSIRQSIYDRIVEHGSTITRESNYLRRMAPDNPAYHELSLWDVLRAEIRRRNEIFFRRGVEFGRRLNLINKARGIAA
jgi:hypothetical protein